MINEEHLKRLYAMPEPQTSDLSLKALRELVDSRAQDRGLWFDAEYISEAVLQKVLRDLHALIEDLTNE